MNIMIHKQAFIMRIHKFTICHAQAIHDPCFCLAILTCFRNSAYPKPIKTD